MKGLGIRNIVKFPFVSSPPSRLLSHGLETLLALKLIDEKGDLTELGKHKLFTIHFFFYVPMKTFSLTGVK